MFASFSFAEIEGDPSIVFNLEDNSDNTVVHDYFNNNNMVAESGNTEDYHSLGIHNSGFDMTSKYMDSASTFAVYNKPACTVNLWTYFNYTPDINVDVIYAINNVAGDRFDISLNSAQELAIYLQKNGGGACSTNIDNLVPASWNMITIVSNSTGIAFYVNNVKEYQCTNTNFNAFNAAKHTFFGIYPDLSPNYQYSGKLDEIYFYNFSMTEEDINESWNGGVGTFYPAPTPTPN